MENQPQDYSFHTYQLHGETQIIIAHRQLDEDKHLVISHGEKPGPFHCVKLTRVRDGVFKPQEINKFQDFKQAAADLGLLPDPTV